MNNLACNIPYNILPFRGTSFPTTLSSPIVNGAVNDMTEKLGISHGLATMSVLSAIAVVSHSLITVRMSDDGSCPVTTFIKIIGNPGVGKTRAIEAPVKLLREFQKLQVIEYNKQLSKYKVKRDIWKKQRKEILNLVSTGIDCDSGADTAEVEAMVETQIEEKLVEHERCKPKKPRALKLLAEDATIEFLHAALSDYPFISLLSNEGNIFFKSRAGSNTEQFSSFWSGSSVIVNRKSGESYELTDASVNILLSVQPGILASYLKGKGKDARSNGFIARCMPYIAEPGAPNLRIAGTSERQYLYLEQHEQRIAEILTQVKAHFDDPSMERKVMEFSHEAMAWFNQLRWEIEQEKAPGRRFANVHDHASRLAEQIARVAALLQYFEDPDSDITVDTLMDAVRICSYCSDCFLTIFDPPPQEYLDAQLLNEWINLNLRSNQGLRLVYKNYIRQFGPNSLREKNRLNHALLLLQQQRVIGLFMRGKQHVIDLHPHMQIDEGLVSFLLGSPKR